MEMRKKLQKPKNKKFFDLSLRNIKFNWKKLKIRLFSSFYNQDELQKFPEN
jgi:hypothetical protein